MEKLLAALVVFVALCVFFGVLVAWWSFWDDKGSLGFFMSLPFPIAITFAIVIAATK